MDKLKKTLSLLYWQSTLKSNANTILTSFFPGKAMPLPLCFKQHVYVMSQIFSLILTGLPTFLAHNFAYAQTIMS